MVIHVNQIIHRQVVIDAALAENRINSIVLSQENISQLLMLLVLLELHRDDLLAELVDEAVKKQC
jgi:hypothetical protein